MPDVTNAALAAQIQAFTAAQFVFLDQQRKWVAGSAADPLSYSAAGVIGGGGYYPMTLPDGTTSYVPAPPVIQSLVGSSVYTDIGLLQAALATGTIAALVGNRVYLTRAALYADLAHAEGLHALVTFDATAANNGLYRKTGASGAGGWGEPSLIFSGIKVAAEAARQLAQDWAEKATAPGGTGTKSSKTLAGEAAGSAVAAAGDRQLANDWAEKATAPGGVGTKSAKTWAGESEASKVAASGFAGEAAASGIVARATSSFQLAPAVIAGWLSVTTDLDGRVARGIRLDGSYYDAFLKLPSHKTVTGLATGDLPAVQVDRDGRPIEQIDARGRRRGNFSGSFTPDRPGALAYIEAGDLYVAGRATKLAGGAANWTGGPTLIFKAAQNEGPIIRAAAARGSAVDGLYYNEAGEAGIYDPGVVAIGLGNGQSNSCGTAGNGARTYIPRTHKIKMTRLANAASDVRSGQYPEIDSAPFAPVNPAHIVGFIELHPQNTPVGPDSVSVFGETHLERLMLNLSNRWFSVTGRRQELLAMSLGVGTATIDILQRTAARPSPWPAPTTTWDVNIFENQMARIERVDALIRASGKRSCVYIVSFVQGETGPTDAGWAAKLATLKLDFNARVKAITGQTWEPVWLMHQITAVASGTPTYSNTQRQQIVAHDAGTAHIVEANYTALARVGGFFTDNVHKDALGYALAGERVEQAFAGILARQQRPSVLRPISAISNGAAVDVTFEVPVAPIVLDAAPGFAFPANYGVTYQDTGGTGSAPTVSSVTVLDADTLRITLSADPAGRTGKRMNFGENGPVVNTAFSAANMARTAIRDSYAAISTVDGLPNRNWCLHAGQPF